MARKNDIKKWIIPAGVTGVVALALWMAFRATRTAIGQIRLQPAPQPSGQIRDR